MADIRKVEPTKLDLTVNKYKETMTKPGDKSVINAYNNEEMMNHYYDDFKGTLLGNKDCLDEYIYDVFDNMDKDCMKKNWLMRKANKNCRLVDKIKKKQKNKPCSYKFEDKDEENQEDEDDDKFEIEEDEKNVGGKSRRRNKKLKSVSTRRVKHY
jgi:hypothetical protein